MNDEFENATTLAAAATVAPRSAPAPAKRVRMESTPDPPAAPVPHMRTGGPTTPVGPDAARATPPRAPTFANAFASCVDGYEWKPCAAGLRPGRIGPDGWVPASELASAGELRDLAPPPGLVPGREHRSPPPRL